MDEFIRDNKKLLTTVLKRITISVDGAEIPLLNRYTEKIEINCHENNVCDIKPTMRFKGEK